MRPFGRCCEKLRPFPPLPTMITKTHSRHILSCPLMRQFEKYLSRFYAAPIRRRINVHTNGFRCNARSVLARSRSSTAGSAASAIRPFTSVTRVQIPSGRQLNQRSLDRAKRPLHPQLRKSALSEGPRALPNGMMVTPISPSHPDR